MAYAESTTVPVEKSRAEIERMLMRFKCTQFLVGVDHEQHMARVQFKAQSRIIRFQVTLPTTGTVQKRSRKIITPSRMPEAIAQAERQCWRALYLVIKAKLESVESQIATFEEEFLAHIVLPNDKTVATMVTPLITAAYAHGKMPLGLLPAGDVDSKD